MRTCIYLRKSRADKDNQNVSDEEVLRRHEETLLAYAKIYNLDIVEIKKEVVSGEKLSRRPKMLKLLEELEDNKYDAVLVMDFDRLGRGNMMEQGLIINAFKESNTKIITPNKVYNLEDDFDEEYLDLSAFFARKELKMITRRLLRGRIKSLEEGNYIGACAPLGYDKKGNSLEINHEESKIVKIVFDLYVNKNYGDKKIANYLKNNNFKTKKGTINWNRTTIRKIIQNPIYIGKISWGKKEYKIDKNGRKTSRLLDVSEWKIYDGKHEPLIKEETFEKAQTLAKERYIPRIKGSYKLRNPLAYIIKCKDCGHTMTLRTSKDKKDTIRCYKSCGNMSSYTYLVEDKLIQILYRELAKLECNFKYNKNNHKLQEINITSSAIINNKKELKKASKQKEVLYELLEQKIYDNKTFLERMKTVTNKIENLNSTLSNLEKKHKRIINKKDEIENKLPKIKLYKEFIEDIYWNSAAQDKNNFLREVIHYVNYKKTKKGKDFEIELFLKI